MPSKKQRQATSRKAKRGMTQAVARLVAPSAMDSVPDSQQQSEEQKAQADQPVQTVGPGSGADQKHRLTLILFQSVEKWFQASETPVGRGEVRSQRDSGRAPLRAVLIVKCKQQCRQ